MDKDFIIVEDVVYKPVGIIWDTDNGEYKLHVMQMAGRDNFKLNIAVKVPAPDQPQNGPHKMKHV